MILYNECLIYSPLAISSKDTFNAVLFYFYNKQY